MDDNLSPTTTLPVIGWREWLALPALGIPGIKAKIDTGARSSALHTNSFEVEDRDGAQWVKFQMHPLTRTNEVEMTCEAPILEFRDVKDSGGHVEHRPFIRTRARLGTYEWDVDMSLTNREGMKFRMLLGREAVASDFLIDPSASYIIGQSLAHQYGI
tara:strand:- start:21819 stop:22292 length:474 start_codon:yes stop_codon:yes gene_type:complete